MQPSAGLFTASTGKSVYSWVQLATTSFQFHLCYFFYMVVILQVEQPDTVHTATVNHISNSI